MHGFGRRRLRPLRRTVRPALVLCAAVPAVWLLVGSSGSAAAPQADASNVPYALPVKLPPAKNSPAVDSSAPYTPQVVNLIHQLEPSNPPTQAELANAAALLHGGTNPTCHNVGPVAAPTGTNPSIAAPCWADAQGINVTSGPNGPGGGGPNGQTLSTSPTEILGLASTFDRRLANVWGQTEGREGRELMVTGLFGPQTDLDRLPNWGRGHQTAGEDPYLSNQIVSSQINGVQGVGLMSQMKHFALYNGQNQNANTDVQDQALHELYLTPYEGGFVDGRAAATMCSYALFHDTSTSLPGPDSTLSDASMISPFARPGQNPLTWPLNESHYACEQPLTLTHTLRDTWGSQALVGSDYPATHSTAAIFQGEDQEMPTSNGYFSDSNTLSTTSGGGFFGPPSAFDPTGDTCADASGNSEPCSTAGAVHVAGIPGPGCPAYGCTLVQAVENGTVPLSVFNQSLARMLYQEQRFGMLGCDQSPPASTCTNPGGIGGDRTGTARIPVGPGSGATASSDLGTENGDAAISELTAEEAGVLFKNDRRASSSERALPIKPGDLSDPSSVFVTGPGAEYLIATPSREASLGFPDRIKINPLQELEELSGKASAFSYYPALSPTGIAVPCSVLDSSPTSGAAPSSPPPSSCGVTSGLQRSSGPSLAAVTPDRVDPQVNYTTASTTGQLAGNTAYKWDGWIYFPSADTYTFRLQYSSTVPSANITFSLDGNQKALSGATTFYNGQYQGRVVVNPTNAGYTEAGLTNVQCSAPTNATPPSTSQCPGPLGTPLSVGWHQVTITLDNTGVAGNPPASFRFAFSRVNQDTADAAAAAAGKKVAIVFANDNGVQAASGPTSQVQGLTPQYVNLINAVAAANPNTIVVLNTSYAVDVQPWLSHVKAVLEMWNSGQEGSVATARLLLGQANPSGHTAMTWPANGTDTIWGYDETKPLYPGDSTGSHPERLNGTAAGGTNETEGIFTGYRFFDKEHIAPRFPFGFGLSYTHFAFSNERVAPTSDGGADVTFTVRNSGGMPGDEVAQVYVGPPADHPAGVQFAVRALAQFDRVSLAAGQSKTVTVHVTPRQLSYWSDRAQRWVRDGAGRTVFVGDADSRSHLSLRATLRSTERGMLTCANAQLNATSVEGTLTVPAGTWCDLERVIVNGNLVIDRASGIRIEGSTIKGNVSVHDIGGASDPLSSGTNVICNDTITGNLTLRGSTARWNLGLCGANAIGKTLACSGNGDLTGTKNKVRGTATGQCARLKT